MPSGRRYGDFAGGGLAGTCTEAGSSRYREAILGDGPIAYWRLGEAPGAATAIDELGGHPGTYQGAPSLGVSGLLPGDRDTAAAFDGIDDRLSAEINLPAGSFSLEALIRPVALPPAEASLFAMEPAGGSGFRFGVSPAGALVLRVDPAGSGPVEVATSDGAIAAGGAHHVVATRSGTTVTIYVDGASAAQASAPIVSPLYGFTIGAANGWGYFAGIIDEPAVYPTALAPAQVGAHFAAAGL